MVKRLLLAMSLFVIPLMAGGCSGAESVTVPVEVRNADDIGAIAFELVYNSALLKVDGVDNVGFSKGADAQYSAATPGRLVVVVQHAPAMNGDGTLVEVHFDILEHSGESSLTLENVQARNRSTLEYIATQTEPGNIQVEDGAYVSPQIIFAQ